VLILEARYYEALVDALVAGATRALEAAGARYERIQVPGALELPAALRMAVNAGRYDGFVALGCVIRGETSHYDYVCGECARGLAAIAAHEAVALGFGVLTCETEAQAWARAGLEEGDKGGDAARACLAMITLRQRLQRPTDIP